MLSEPDISAFMKALNDDSELVLEGFHVIKHALRFNAQITDAVCTDKQGLVQLAKRLAPDTTDFFSKTREISEASFKKIFDFPPRTGVVAIAPKPSQQIPTKGTVVLLDNPKNLGNLGNVIRTSAAAGASAVITTGQTDPWHRKVLVSSAGLNFALTVTNANLDNLKGFSVVAFDERGDDWSSFKPSANQILMFGSERSGLSDDLTKRADTIVRIPMKSGVSSINLASSVAIALYKSK